LQEASQDYRKAMELDPDSARGASLLARLLSRMPQGDLSEALYWADLALQRDPEDPTAWDAKGWALFRLGRPKEALIFCEKALELDPSDAEVRGHLRLIEQALG